MIELDLFGEPVSNVPIPLARKEFTQFQKEEAKSRKEEVIDNPPTLPLDFKVRGIEAIIKEAIPGGVRTTIWNTSR